MEIDTSKHLCLLEEKKSLIDPSTQFHISNLAIGHVLTTKGIACLSTITEPVYMMSEQAYKYMLSKCTEDEAFDLGILGQSEEHVKVNTSFSSTFKRIIKDRK